MIDIWDVCNGVKHISEIKDIAWRIVALQEKTATRKLVDSLEEQKILDALIEESKSSMPISYFKFHPLIYTPFRNPPLKQGSRFGSRMEPSIWYGSIKVETAVAEKAYYQLLLLNGSTAAFENVESGFTLFSVNLKTTKGIKLDEEPFVEFKDQISSPTDYKESQILGLKMRENKIDAFSFSSSRDPYRGSNIGLYNINSFVDRHPNEKSFQTWQCSATKNLVDFTQVSTIEERTLSFPRELFLINGNFPSPAL